DAAAGRPGAAAGPEPDPPGAPLHGLAVLEVFDRLGGRAGVDPPLLVRVTGQQAMVADDVDDARDPLAVVGDPLDGGVGEDAAVRRAGDAQAMLDVRPDLLGLQRPDVGAQADALLELAQLGAVDLAAQLRLA